MVDGFYCKTCGQFHAGLPLDYSAEAPAPWYSIPEDEREARCDLTTDVCVIDGRQFFVRGCLEIPLLDGTGPFVYGVWTSLSEKSFRRMYKLWDSSDRESEPPFFGWLCTSLPLYPETYLLKTHVHLRAGNQRPYVELERTDHPLAVEQRTGITMERVREIAEQIGHGQYASQRPDEPDVQNGCARVPQALPNDSSLSPSVELVTGDLLDQEVEAIVNAWNRNVIPWWLLWPQGVSGAIKRRAGLGPFRELARRGPIPLGGAVLTSAGLLPFRGIIHVAGINLLWRASEYSIRTSVRNAVRLAQENGFKSLAFPLLGSGSGGCDREQAKSVMLDELRRVAPLLSIKIVDYRR